LKDQSFGGATPAFRKEFGEQTILSALLIFERIAATKQNLLVNRRAATGRSEHPGAAGALSEPLADAITHRASLLS
jgi:hypothetical protein